MARGEVRSADKHRDRRRIFELDIVLLERLFRLRVRERGRLLPLIELCGLHEHAKHFFARISPAGVLVSAVPIPDAKEISASPKLATRGATTVIAVQTGQGLTLLRPE